MNRKLTVFCTVLFLLVASLSFGVVGADQGITVKVNGEVVQFPDAKPFINSDNRTVCPVRFVSEALGAEVGWDGQTRTVTLLRGSDTIALKIGESKALVNGEEKSFDTRAVIVEDRTFVPLRFISEVLGELVDWDNKTRTVSVLTVSQAGALFDPSSLTDEEKEITYQLEEYLTALQKNKNFHGSVLVAKEGKVLIDQGYGYANFEQAIENTANTKMPIGSVTKQFTSMAIMQLQEEGLLSVQDAVYEYFPEYPRGDEITLHHLLTHTSGIADYTSLPGFMSLQFEEDKYQMIEQFKNLPLNFNPGEQWSYSNSGYLLLDCIIEKVSGMDYEDYLEENIFKPLGMERTSVAYVDGKKMYDATGYAGYLEVQPLDDEYMLKRAYGAGNLCSTVEDLYRWDRVLYTDTLAKQETLDTMFEAHVDTGVMGHYGYAWIVNESESGKEVVHTGGTFSFTSVLSRYIDQDITIIVLTNHSQYSILPLKNTLADIVQGKEYELPKAQTQIDVDPEIYTQYIGKYQFVSQPIAVTITTEDGRLFAQVTGQQAIEIFPETEEKYFYKAVDAKIMFVKDDEGKYGRMLFEQGGTSFDAIRVEEEPKKEVDVDPQIYDDYVGEYELVPGFVVTITKEDGRLYAQATNQGKHEIFPSSETKFFYKTVDAEITFVRGEAGDVTSLILHQAGQEMEAKKVQ